LLHVFSCFCCKHCSCVVVHPYCRFFHCCSVVVLQFVVFINFVIIVVCCLWQANKGANVYYFPSSFFNNSKVCSFFQFQVFQVLSHCCNNFKL
jgi:hypothetical protein